MRAKERVMTKKKKSREGFVQCNNVNNHLYEDSK